MGSNEHCYMSQGHLLQNIVSFVGLFCKSTGMRECVTRDEDMGSNEHCCMSQRHLLQNIVSFVGLFYKRDL